MIIKNRLLVGALILDLNCIVFTIKQTKKQTTFEKRCYAYCIKRKPICLTVRADLEKSLVNEREREHAERGLNQRELISQFLF